MLFTSGIFTLPGLLLTVSEAPGVERLIRRGWGLSWIWLSSAVVFMVGPGARVLLSPLWCCFTAQSLHPRPCSTPEHPGVPKPQLTLATSLKHPGFSTSLRRIQLPSDSALCSWTLSCQSEFSQPLSSGERTSGQKRFCVLSRDKQMAFNSLIWALAGKDCSH